MSLRLRRGVAISAVLLLVAGVFAALNARAATVSNFAIDGQIQRQGTPDDWANGSGGNGVIQQTRNSDGTCTAPAAGVAALLVCDPVKTDASTFPGGAKEPDPTGWIPIQTSQVTPKTDITNVYALGRIDSNGDPIIYNGMERLPKAGDVHLDFEFNQQVTGTAPNQIPARQVGDLLIAYDLGGSVSTNLGSLEIRVFQAKAGLGCNGSCPGYDYANPDSSVSGNSLPVSGTGVVGTMNTGTINSGPWMSYDDHYKLISTLDAFGFAEASIDLKQALQNQSVCVNFMTVKSRASESVTSQLKDTTLSQPFPFCGGIKIHKFIDVNADGVNNTGDFAGQGWNFTVTGPNGSSTVVCSGATDANGDLSCPDLLPGSYVVTETQKDHWTTTKPAGSTSQTVNVAIGQTATVTFGNTCYVQKTFTVTNVPSGYTPYAWYKQNGGSQVNVPLTLSGSTASATVSDHFTAKDTIDWGWGISAPAQQKTVKTGEKMSAGAYPTCALTNTDAFPRTTLNGTKYKDAMGTATNAPPLTAFTFRLHRTDATATDLTTTQGIDPTNSATFGKYSFANITPGTYVVSEDSKAGWAQTAPLGGTATVTVSISDTGPATIPAFGNTPLSDVGVTFKPESNPAATKATIDCGSLGSSTNGTLSATGVQIGTYNCKVTITDP